MKVKLISVFCIFCLTSLYVNAQEGYLGLKTAYNISRLNSDNESVPGIDDRHTIGIGLVYAYQFRNATFGVSWEPGYLLKGARIDNDTLDYRLNYITSPVLLDIYPVKRVKISVGPEIAYLASARSRTNDTTKVSILNTFNNRWELSGTVGISYSPDFFIDFGVRYNRAFTDAADMDAVLNRRKLYNEYFQFYMLLKIAN